MGKPGVNGEPYEAYRENKIASGLLYQDFVVDACFNLRNLVIQQYASRHYQATVGESKTGAEIKHDEMYATTGNLYIEVAEKARPRQGDYVPSGIFRNDNTWLYIIGDYDTIFIFTKKLLQCLAKCGSYKIFPNKTETSKGFLLPDVDAKKYAAEILTPNAAEKVPKFSQDIMAIGRELHALAMRPNGRQLDLFKYGPMYDQC